MKQKYWIFGLFVALFMATILSLFASPDPDGLERVAEDHGFIGKDSGSFFEIMPDYVVPGIENETIAASLAGLIGTLIVFGLTIGVGIVLKRKNSGN